MSTDQGHIDQEVLSQALTTLGDPRLSVGSPQWQIETFHRRRSVVSRLTNEDGSIIMYYKQLLPVGQVGLEPKDSLQSRLRRTASLTAKASRRLSGAAVSIPEVLAVDPEKLIIVTRAMAGAQLKRGQFTRAMIRSRDFYAPLLGRAFAVIEQVGGESSLSSELEGIQRNVDRRLEVAGIGASEAAAVRQAVEIAAESSRDAYCHGDLSHSNILLSPGRAAIIDFGWSLRPRGYDVGLFSYRVAQPTKMSPRVGLQFVNQMMGAYQEALGESYHPSSLAFVDLLMLIRGITSQSYLLRSRSYRKLLRLLKNGSLGRDVADSGGPFPWSWT